MMPNKAMVFAAGLGTRMRAHRSDIPKPLVPVAGRTLIDRVLDKLAAAGVGEAVINVSYLGEMIIRHLEGRNDIRIHFSVEETPLETGGGILKALPLLGEEPFFIINSDITWMDGAVPALNRLAENFHQEQGCQTLLLMSRLDRTLGYPGQGDFILQADGRFRLPDEAHPPTHVFTGVQIMNPAILQPYRQQGEGVPVFSLGQLFRDSLRRSVLPTVMGLEHDALWLHIGDGDGVHEAEAYYAAERV